MARITESQLVLPALYVMHNNGGTISTSTLITALTNIMHPTGEDVKTLDNRADTKFSQIVRNLKSHSTFERNGYANNNQDGFEISDLGKEYLSHNQEIIEYLLSNDFNYDDVKNSFGVIEQDGGRQEIQTFDENLLIYEGRPSLFMNKKYERSVTLRNAAIEYYLQQGGLDCQVCNFNFERTYGTIGKGYMEMHHKRPIYKYAAEDIKKTLQEAIQNVVPLCSNCHRMIHRNRTTPLSVDDLRQYIR